MKIHLVLISLILGGEWAHGTVQTSLDQDPPPYVSVQNYTISLNGQGTASYIGGLKEYEQWGGGLAGGSASGSGSWMYQYYDNIYTPNGWGENYSWSWSSPTNYIQVWSAWGPPSPSVSLTSTNGGAICAPQVVCDYYYYYTNGFEPMYGSYYFTLEESTTAHTTIILHTGGKPTSRLRNIIALNGWGASQMVPNLYFNADQFNAGGFCGYYGGGTNFPAKNVSLGSLGVCASDANGNKYVVLPDNSTADVTPMVAGVPCYVCNIGSLQKYKLTIVARGNGTNYDLSTNTPEFCAGQLLTFQPSWSPSTPPYTNSVQHWTLPDKYVNQPTNYSATCATYVKNTDLLTNLVNQCWYVNGNGGTASIGMNLKFSNGQTAGIAAMGQFSVYRPSVNQPVTYTPYGAAIAGGMLSLEDGPMRFDVTINSKYPGAFGLTQLVKMYSETISVPPDVPEFSSTWGSFYLDWRQYYDGPTAVTNTCHINDSPGQPLLFEIGDYTGNWKDYVSFTPNGGIPVTLGRIDWNWAATCANPDPLIGWYITSDGVDGPAFYDDDSFPLWTNVKPAPSD